ncbi:MAG TPA: molybdopterin cofactor-binding domain-containing protein [Bacteroidales bacterium]|nr:molybdopterin cofactor-binding domain-containing protein [Bacteroidales bacterium]
MNKNILPGKKALPRRDFVKLLGGGIIIVFNPLKLINLPALPADQGRALPSDYNAFLRIAEDGTVTCFTGKIEMGQGIITSLPQMMADELDVPLEKVKIIMGDTDLCPYDAGTWGSLSTRVFGPSMRAAAAEARMVLVDLASQKLNVPAAQLEIRDGMVVDKVNKGKSVSYGQLAKGQKIEKHLDIKPSVEDFSKFTIVGKPLKRADALEKVTGAAKYAGDIKLDGMVYARILRPPSHGAKLKTVNWSEAEKVPGTEVVREGDLIAVLNPDRDSADEAVVKITAEYSFNEKAVSNNTISDWLLKNGTKPRISRTKGDAENGLKLSDKIFESEFHFPYLAHSPIETHTALAEYKDGRITVWAATQSPFGLQDGISRELKLPRENVRVITPFVGGGFGGKSMYTQGVEAARLARLANKPVMVLWTREEEFFYDIFHPAGVIKVRSGIDRDGLIKLWDYSNYFGGTRGNETIYDVPNDKVTEYSGDTVVHPFATGPWRAPNAQDNTFAREVQIDIMASAASIDPLEFRMKNLTDQSMKDCLKAVAELFGYKPSKGRNGTGVGIAVGLDAGTLVAEMAEVSVDTKTGRIDVKRIACAQDMGLCVNPQGATLQMEGCMMMGLGFTLSEEVEFEGGKVLTTGFDNYSIPKFVIQPELKTKILDRKDKPPQGGGEPAIIPIAAVVANAVYAATGARLYTFPLTPARVLEALKKV